MRTYIVLVLLLVLEFGFVHSAGQSRFLFRQSGTGIDLGSNSLVSDGVHQSFSSGLILKPGSENRQSDSGLSSSTCDQTYGCLPCTASVIGNLFLMVAYGYLMYIAATWLSNGSELLLGVMGPGIIGGLFLPILGALPDAMLILELIPQIIRSSSGKRIAILVACIVAILCLLSYCMYQVLEPWIQKRRMEYAKHKHMISVILNVMQKEKWGRLLRDDGQPDFSVIDRIFDDLDEDKDGYLSRGELRGLIIGLELSDRNTSTADAVDKIMSEFDTSRDKLLNGDEFRSGLHQWLRIACSTVDSSNGYSKKFMPILNRYDKSWFTKTKEELDNLENGTHEKENEVDNPFKVYLKAVLLMLGGAVLAGIFADPLVDAVDNFSDATSIPSFFISFIVMPLATNSSEGVSALIFASRKRMRTASLTYSEIYGAVTMNNTLCLGVFLAIVYIRGLDWDFSAEVLVILLVVIVMGLLSSFRTTFPLWMSFIAFLFYPLSLAIVYILDYILGWS